MSVIWNSNNRRLPPATSIRPFHRTGFVLQFRSKFLSVREILPQSNSRNESDEDNCFISQRSLCLENVEEYFRRKELLMKTHSIYNH